MKKDQTEDESASQIVETDVYVPVMSFNDINLNTIETIQRTLNKDASQSNVVLAIVESKSTILYYRMTNTLLDLHDLS